MSISSTQLLAAAGVIGTSMLWAPAASADGSAVLGIDGEWVRAAAQNDTPSDTGLGIHARLGYQEEALLFYLRPEIGASATFFDSISDDIQWRGYGGARLGLNLPLSPAAFIHGGYGWYSNDERGFTWDFGGALDLAFLPFMNLGAHIAYTFNPDPVPNWLSVGGHVEFFFF